MDTRDVTIAYDDGTKGTICTRDITLAYDDDARRDYGYQGCNINL